MNILIIDGANMRKILLALLLIQIFFAGTPCWGAQDTLGNIKPGQAIPHYVPGTRIALPDGRQAIIQEYLPNGQLKTDIGIILSPEGVIVEGQNQGQSVTIIQPDNAQTGIQPPAPAILPETSGINPQQGQAAEPEKQAGVPGIQENPGQEQPAIISPQNAPTAPDQALTPRPAEPEGPVSIVELLPMTTLPATQRPEEKAVAEPEKKALPKTGPEKKPDQKKPVEPNQKKPVKPKKAPEQKKVAEPEKPQKKEPEKFKKPAVGQELRIPPNAAQTGNLDFLEGCWQGTRPEYYSKRTIKECFCFNATGKNGKRRVFDPQGKRMCIGSARANLSKAGVLSVTSSGAACNDGERWGSAQMSCKNSGPKTPCSWIFPDTHGGHQSYTIPFVRVESCGR